MLKSTLNAIKWNKAHIQTHLHSYNDRKANGPAEGNRQALENASLNVWSNHEKRKLSICGGGGVSTVDTSFEFCWRQAYCADVLMFQSVIWPMCSTYIMLLLYCTKRNWFDFVWRQQAKRNVYYHHFNFLPFAVFSFHSFPSSFAFWFSAF